ncbi:uncharacterized protein LOC122501890 [Leptopilina heterotoma]|uniref:uncharacterized protein LOC122501890 n=1 Tax=Leptopilina heterotoma TaxID=63436 RepID=UPI001CA7ECB8|nr:uncharacterized protein LOC122501890 [Leptopilina heterotoma]
MLKLFCVFFISLALGNALDKKAEISYGRFLKGREIPGVTIESSEEKSEITWNESVNVQENSLRATIRVDFTKSKKSDYIVIPNLCDTYNKSTFHQSGKLFVLKMIANVKNCPIKEGTKSTYINEPKTFLYSLENDRKCGPFQAEMKVFRKMDKLVPIILGYFQGNITGC